MKLCPPILHFKDGGASLRSYARLSIDMHLIRLLQDEDGDGETTHRQG